jgi:diguanylate cyclase (GGDEF)-like protein
MVTRNNTLRSPNNEIENSQELLKTWVEANRSMMEVFLDAYCVVDLLNNVVDFNVAFTELCGESYRKILKIGSFCDLVRTELCPHQCPSVQVVNSKKTLRLDEVKGSSKAFPQLQMILGGVPIFEDGTQNLIGSLITIRNVSAENELQKKYDERKKESITDGLTRLYNKVFTEESLLRFIKMSLRDSLAVSVVMCDIDHFKKVNDTYGHQAGDYVLYTVSQILKGESRDSDIVGRFGGEEFLIILSNSDAAGANIFSERFRKHIESTTFLFEGKNIPVTVSVGTASFTKTWRPGLSPERMSKELVNCADTALYYSKANGRNRTCQYETLPTTKK